MAVIDIPNLRPDVARGFVAAPEGYTTNVAFYDGDHWQWGNGWVGPKPWPSEPGADKAMTLLKQGFVSRNVIKEVTTRHRDGVVGIEPVWRFVPDRALKPNEELKTEEATAQAEIHAVLTTWYDRRGIHDKLKEAVTLTLLGERCVLRLYVPPGRQTIRQEANGGAEYAVLEAPDLAAALDMIYVDVLGPDRAAIVTDDDTKRELGIVVHSDQSVELTYLDPETGETWLRTVKGGVDEAVAMPLAGRLTMFQLEREPFITEQVRQLQRSFNLALSALPMNVITGAYLERILTNAQMPGEWENDSRGKPLRFRPAPYRTGPGTTQFLQGLVYKDPESGKTQMATPGVHFREPTDVKPTIDAKGSHYLDLLEEVNQSHIIMDAEAAPSGKSRDESRAGFKRSLSTTASPTARAGRWLLETVLQFGLVIIKKPELYPGWRAEFECRLDVGPLSTAEQQNVMTAVEKKLMSPDTAMGRLGILDTDAERIRIQSDPLSKIKVLKEQLEVITAGQRASMDLRVLAEEAGMDPALIKKLIPETLPPDDPNNPANRPGEL